MNFRKWFKNIFFPNPKPEENLPELDFDDIYKYGEMSKMAYKHPSDIKNKYGKNLIKIYKLDKTNGLGFLIKDTKKKEITIVTRGTNNVKNWFVDANFVKRFDSKLRIYLHKGFKTASDEFYSAIKDVIFNTHKQGYKFNVTGHSLGGAVAVIISMNLNADGYSLGKTITFGQPKVTNTEGIEKFKRLNVLRIVDNEDLVPLVPPILIPSLCHGMYRHLGLEVILLKEKYIVYLNKKDSKKLGVSSLWVNIDDVKIKDHYMDNYLDHMKAKKKEYQIVLYKDRKKYQN